MNTTDLEEARALWRLCGDMTLPLTVSDRVRIANSFRAVIDMAKCTEEFDAFRQEVSDAVEGFWNYCRTTDTPFPADLDRFILPKPVDPLVEAWQMAFPGNHIDDAREECAKINAALAARGLKIVEDKP